MAEIVPAVLESGPAAAREKILRLDGLAGWIQVDIADGEFVAVTTWRSPDELKGLGSRFKIEVHLMIKRPEETLRGWMEVADRVIVHPEATERLGDILATLAASPVESGVALLLSTPLVMVEPHLNSVDLVQLMGIAEIGFQGQPFDSRVLERVRFLREKHPDVKIAVDGGVNLGNAEKIFTNGADNLAVGSALWRSADPTAALRQFQKIAADFSLRQ